jgi:membrane protein EpsK
VQPLFSLNRAYNKVKIPGLVTLGMGVANLLLAVCFVKYTSLGLYGIAIAIGIVLTIKNFLFMPIYVAMNMGISKWSFIKTPLKSVIILFFALIFAYVSDDYIHIKNWLHLILFSGILFLFFSGFAYLFLTKDEKYTIMSTFLKKGKVQKTDNLEVIK